MSSNEIIEELRQADKWLGDEYKNSNYYKEYLNQLFIDLSNTITI